MTQTLNTKQGALPLPLFVPQLTLPLGERTVPYLHNLSYCVALDPFTSSQLTPETLPALPKWAVPYQLHQTEWTPADGYAVRVNGQRLERESLLQFQSESDIGLTLAIPPGRTHPSIRLQRSCDNARWALKQQSGIPLLAALPFTTVEDTCLAVQSLWSPRGGFSGIALWVDNPLLDDLLETVVLIRQSYNGPLHLCGVDDPTAWPPLVAVGVSSLHSANWLDWAQQGRKFGVEGAIPNPTRDETLHLALLNLALATQLSLPLSMMANDFSTWLLRDEAFRLPIPQ